tara:strand:+ start:108 stop:419 length:312 start_codon:yes stop_codon:yes gene_type:complete
MLKTLVVIINNMGIIDKIKTKRANKKNPPESAIQANARLYNGAVKSDAFYIDKSGKEFSRKDYFSMAGTNKYTKTAIDKYIYENSTQSMNKKKRKLKIRRNAK